MRGERLKTENMVVMVVVVGGRAKDGNRMGGGVEGEVERENFIVYHM